jgi:hypothetical protein
MTTPLKAMGLFAATVLIGVGAATCVPMITVGASTPPIQSSPPSTDPCTYPSPPPGIVCSAPITQGPSTAPPDTAPLQPCPPQMLTGSWAPGFTAMLSGEFSTVQRLPSSAGFDVSQADATTAALSGGRATVCSAFPAIYQDAGSPDNSAKKVWVIGIWPANPITSHPSNPHATPQAATFVYVFVDGTTGQFISEQAGYYASIADAPKSSSGAFPLLPMVVGIVGLVVLSVAVGFVLRRRASTGAAATSREG